MEMAPEANMAELQAIEAMMRGWAQPYHFDVLADCQSLVTIAANHKHDKDMLAVCDLASIALLNIRDRYESTKKLGCTGEELAALRALVEVSNDWWKRQSGELYRAANEALDHQRGYVRRKAA